MCAQKIRIFCSRQYCTGYRIIPYGQPGTRVFGAQDEAVVSYFEVLDQPPEIGIFGIIPDFFPVTPLLPECQTVIDSGEFTLPRPVLNQLCAFTSRTWYFFVRGLHGILESQAGLLDIIS